MKCFYCEQALTKETAAEQYSWREGMCRPCRADYDVFMAEEGHEPGGPAMPLIDVPTTNVYEA